MTSIVIAAHNEEAVIERTIRAVLSEAAPGELEVVVVANGCSDRTAAVARTFSGIRVIDLPSAGKARALNAGDASATSFPRIYLDADIVLTTANLRALVNALHERSRDAPLAATVGRRVGLDGSPWMVRAYYAINTRLPTFEQALFGRGVVALTEQGRARFGQFPEQIADDLYLDSLFAPREKVEVGSVLVTVNAPKTTGDLVRRLTRVRRGNNELRQAAADEGGPRSVRPTDRWAWFRGVVLKNPDSRLRPCAT